MSSQNPNTYRNPRRINEPLLIFAWPLPKVMPVFCFVGMSMIVGFFTFFMTLSVIWWIVYGQLEDRGGISAIFHFLWWHGWTTGLTDESSTIPDPMKREFFQQ